VIVGKVLVAKVTKALYANFSLQPVHVLTPILSTLKVAIWNLRKEPWEELVLREVRLNDKGGRAPVLLEKPKATLSYEISLSHAVPIFWRFIAQGSA